MQMMVISSNFYTFQNEINELLAKGWTVVPGTMFAGSVKTKPDKTHVNRETDLKERYGIFIERNDEK